MQCQRIVQNAPYLAKFYDQLYQTSFKVSKLSNTEESAGKLPIQKVSSKIRNIISIGPPLKQFDKIRQIVTTEIID